MRYDIVISGGEVIDGTGAPRHRADVGIIGGTVAAIGNLAGELTSSRIDAEGCFVAPGFIDGHTHLDAAVNWDPLATSLSFHGVTTAIMGNCGFTLAPCRERDIDLVLRNLERSEDIPRESMLAGIKWNWETFPQFLDHLEVLDKAINYGAYIGHSALRTYVMGERAFDRPASDADLAAMRGEVRRAIEAGAIGFSTSRSSNHETSDDRPVASRVATWGELADLVDVLGDLKAGVVQLAPLRSADPAERQMFSQQLAGLAERGSRPVTFMIGSDPWLLDLVEQIHQRASTAIGQVHCREYLTITGFGVGLPFDQLPEWKAFRARPLDEQLGLLAQSTVRDRLVEEARVGPSRREVGPTRAPLFDQMRILNTPDGPYQTVGEVARQGGRDPLDVIIDLSIASKLEQLFAQPIMGSNLDMALRAMRHPRTVIAASDSGAHVSQIIDSSIPTYLLAHWVRQEAAFGWEEAVQMLTTRPAQIWGLAGRGQLAVGWCGDAVVFDPETVGPTLPTVAHDLPGGATRLVQRATGIRSVVVNGVEVLQEGSHTGRFPGQVLRGGRPEMGRSKT